MRNCRARAAPANSKSSTNIAGSGTISPTRRSTITGSGIQKARRSFDLFARQSAANHADRAYYETLLTSSCDNRYRSNLCQLVRAG